VRYGSKEKLKIFLKGLAMGSADAVPGVSGGTIALIAGIYERLIQAVSGLTPSEGIKLVHDIWEKDFEKFKQDLKRLEVPFLSILGLGIITALILMLRFMHFAINSFPAPTYGFFTGLIAVSAVVLYSEVDLGTRKRKLTALTGFLLAFTASGFGASSPGHTVPILFFAGMLAISGMVLPGISGSLILVILGQYDFMSQTLTEFTSAIPELLRGLTFTPLQEKLMPMTVFMAGAFTGLFTTVNIVGKALEHRRKATMVFLVSMIVGALRAPILQLHNKLRIEGLTWISVLPEFTVALILGGLTIILFSKKSK